MAVTLTVDETHVDPVVADVIARRGRIRSRTEEAGRLVVLALVPLSELWGFERHIRSRTRGSAACSIRFAGYEAVVQGPDGEDDYSFGVRVPRRPGPTLGGAETSVPEPEDDFGDF